MNRTRSDHHKESLQVIVDPSPTPWDPTDKPRLNITQASSFCNWSFSPMSETGRWFLLTVCIFCAAMPRGVSDPIRIEMLHSKREAPCQKNHPPWNSWCRLDVKLISRSLEGLPEVTPRLFACYVTHRCLFACLHGCMFSDLRLHAFDKLCISFRSFQSLGGGHRYLLFPALMHFCLNLYRSVLCIWIWKRS